MFWPCCSLFSFKAPLYFRHMCYFSEIIFFKALSAFIALYFRFIALYLIHGALFHSWRFYLAKSLYSNLSKCRKALYHIAFTYHSAFTQFFLSASKCLYFILLSMEQCPISLFQNMHQLLFEFLDVKRLIS
jgi:hypothetical protein